MVFKWQNVSKVLLVVEVIRVYFEVLKHIEEMVPGLLDSLDMKHLHYVAYSFICLQPEVIETVCIVSLHERDCSSCKRIV